MPIIKMFGTCLILLTGCMAGKFLTEFEKKKLSVLENWIDLIGFIRSQIDCFLMPLDEILSVCPKSLLPVLSKVDPFSLSDCLKATELYLDAESKRLILSFIREIGSSYKEEQMRRCDYYTEALLSIRARKKEDLPQRQKLIWGLSFCASLGVAILFW